MDVNQVNTEQPSAMPLVCPRCGARRQSIAVAWTYTKAWCMNGHVMFKQKFADPRKAGDSCLP